MHNDIKNLSILEDTVWAGVPMQFKRHSCIFNESGDRVLSLMLHNLNLSTLPPEIGNFRSLKNLILMSNSLKSIPPEIGNLRSLQKLALTSNQLTHLPPEIGKLESLVKLDLDNNSLQVLPPEIGRLQNLVTLNLTQNTLLSLPLEIGQLERLKYLYLGNNGLTELPETIGAARNLQKIYLANNELSSLPTSISQLQHLNQLTLNNNNISRLPAEIGSLEMLSELNLNNNILENLPATIGHLKFLRRLEIADNVIVTLPAEIGQLHHLEDLDAKRNQLISIPAEIGQLQNIKYLRLSNNRLNAIPQELGKLPKIQSLILNQNEISTLPYEVALLDITEDQTGALRNNNILHLKENPLTDPPLEIINQGPSAIKAYFSDLAEKIQLDEVKILLVGDGGAGKTSLVKRLCGQHFDPNEPQTDGISIRDWNFTDGERKIIGHFWDFGGQEIMHSTHQFFLSKRSVYILVLDGRRDDNTEYWLKTINSFGGDSPILIVLNKIDQNPGYEVNRRHLEKKYPGIIGFYRISCESSSGIADFCKALWSSFQKVELLQTTYPKTWLVVKQSLEEMNKPFINMNSYKEICDRKNIQPEARDVLVRFLADLGTVVHFSDFDLRDVYVLNPEWVTHGVYTIINSKHLAGGKGSIHLSSLPELLDHNLYPPGKHQYLVALMEKFELCYRLDGDRETILVPDLLDVSEPEFEFHSDSLRFRFTYDFLPPSVMPRLIVRMHQDILYNLRWRTGVVLNCKTTGSTAKVVADREARTLSIEVEGGKDRRDYLAIICHQIRAIHSSFEEIHVTEGIPLPDDPSIVVPPDHLRHLIELGIEDFLPQGAMQVYSARKLLGLIHNEVKIKQIFSSLERIEGSIAEINQIDPLDAVNVGAGVSLNLGKVKKYFLQSLEDNDE